MFLSCLLIDTAANADRPRPGRNWILNPYRVHQRLCMAFPSTGRKAKDEQFLDPFVPEEFQTLSRIGCEQAGRNDKPKPHTPNDKHVHTVRDAAGGFLFRIDAVPGTSPSRHHITVQSATEPDWDYAFHNAPEFLATERNKPWEPDVLAAEPIVKPFAAEFGPNLTLRFRLRANPTKRLCSPAFRPDVHKRRAHWYEKVKTLKSGEKRHPSRRVGITAPDEQLVWLNEKAKHGGFEVAELHKAFSEGTLTAWKANHDEGGSDHRISLASAFFEGRLIVRDAEKFRRTLLAGVGSAKGLGFGLLSVTER